MRQAVVAGMFAALGVAIALPFVGCATPPIDDSLDSDDTVLPTRTPVADGGPDTGTTSTDSGSGASDGADADAGIDAASLVPSGTFSGMYTNDRPNNGCTFMNAGTLSATFATTGKDLTTTATVTGLEIRDEDCNLVDQVGGNAPSSAVTNDAGTFTGTWSVNVDEYGGQLDLPFTATLSGKMITGKWTCTGCTGGFTISAP